MTRTIDLINHWLSFNHLTLNPSKSKYICTYSSPINPFDHYPSLNISDSSLKRVHSFVYLGLTITCSLSWSAHIHKICSNARKLVGLIYRHFYRHFSPVTMLKLYLTLIHPILEYCMLHYLGLQGLITRLRPIFRPKNDIQVLEGFLHFSPRKI